MKHFLAEYLGSPRHPVPFGGRARDFAHLDAWLADQDAPPYLLLAAPAGRGKSALLLRWCQRLLARPDPAVVYFPVSIRFRTNLAGVVFPALAALLANLHGEKLPADPNMHEEVWRGLLVDYMTRPLPDGRSLVLDGVDEAADWVAGPGLFPPDPPRGLRVVLSARYLANDQDVTAWLQRLDWTRPGLASTLQLYPLDRVGIASVLIQMGFPLDLLGARVNIVSELHRLSEGDPLLVRLYVDDLWERGEAAVVLKPEDLRAIRPGLAGYFERWWKDQRLLWSKASPQREAAAQALLNLLAGALGPLSKEDILSLAPDEAGFRTGVLEQHLSSLSRFVIGDGMHQGYVFSHPRLGNYFLEERHAPGGASGRKQQPRGFAAQDFAVEWQAQLARCPCGQRSQSWSEGHDKRGKPITVIQFAKAVCQACSVRSCCTRSPDGRSLTLAREPVQQALEQRRREQVTPAFQKPYARRAGVEATISQGVRTKGLRQARCREQDKVHWHHLQIAAAINRVRIDSWLYARQKDRPARRKRPLARFGRLQQREAS